MEAPFDAPVDAADTQSSSWSRGEDFTATGLLVSLPEADTGHKGLMPPDFKAENEAGAALHGDQEADGLRAAPAEHGQSGSARRRGAYARTWSGKETQQGEAQKYFEMLADSEPNPRPSLLDDDSALSPQVFVERPIIQRRKGFDRWVTSGGRKGATDVWLSPSQGVRKRYGRLIRSESRDDAENLKFAQYMSIRRVSADAPIEEVREAALWALYPVAPGGEKVPEVVTGEGGLSVRSRPACSDVTGSGDAPPSLLLRAGARQKFISFETEPTASTRSNSIELGAVVRAGEGGVKLVSTQGDFAEWHRLANGEPPLSEGDVVGFHRGRISRNTRNVNMLGVVTRKAVVEGSAPPADERHHYDTIAYQGVVPVKVSGQPRAGLSSCDCPTPQAGQLLVPSGRHDGAAVLVPPSEGLSRVGILLDAADNLNASGSADVSWSLMQAVVVSPAETVVGSRRAAKLWRLVVVAMLILAVAVVVDFVVASMLPNHDQPAMDSDANATEGGTFRPSANGVFHRSCFHVVCWPYLERNAELDYDAIIFFPGMRYYGMRARFASRQSRAVES